MICPNCNQMVEEGSRFCEYCGAQMPQSAAPAGGASCPGCGAPVNPGDRFCENCGTPISQSAPAPTYTPEPAPTYAPEPSFGGGASYCECGAAITPGDRFCENCGRPVAQSAPAPAYTPEPAYAPEPEPAIKPMIGAEPVAQASPTPEPVAETPLKTAPMVMLIGESKSYNITSFPSVVGKGSAADTLVAGDESVSRTHLRVVQVDDGFAVEDLNSTNRTYLNGSALTPHTLVPIKSDDTLKMGDTKLKVDIR